mgnify:CR=1 FL=1|jgi:hypothetical protein
MTQIEWQQLEATVQQMSAAEKQRLAGLLAHSETPTAHKNSDRDPVIGLFADEPELMEQVIELIYRDRETTPFRVTE